MSNINCSSSECAFMYDGKCCLDTITENTEKLTGETAELCESGAPKPCPYYVNKT